MAVVTDIDLSFDTVPSTGDVATLEDESAVKNTLYNNLLVGHEDRYFYDGIIESIEDLLFERVDAVTKRLIKNTISSATDKDDRIQSVQDIKVTFDDVQDAYIVNIYLIFDLREKSENKEINISLVLKR